MYDNNEVDWPQGVSILINDCLDFFVIVTNYDEQMILSANFTIEYKDNEQTIERNNTIYPYTQEFPLYRPQDSFQHKFIEDKEYQVSAVVQNAARRYFSGGTLTFSSCSSLTKFRNKPETNNHQCSDK